MNGVEKAVNGVTALGTIIMHIVKQHFTCMPFSESENQLLITERKTCHVIRTLQTSFKVSPANEIGCKIHN